MSAYYIPVNGKSTEVGKFTCNQSTLVDIHGMRILKLHFQRSNSWSEILN